MARESKRAWRVGTISLPDEDVAFPSFDEVEHVRDDLLSADDDRFDAELNVGVGPLRRRIEEDAPGWRSRYAPTNLESKSFGSLRTTTPRERRQERAMPRSISEKLVRETSPRGVSLSVERDERAGQILIWGAMAAREREMERSVTPLSLFSSTGSSGAGDGKDQMSESSGSLSRTPRFSRNRSYPLKSPR